MFTICTITPQAEPVARYPLISGGVVHTTDVVTSGMIPSAVNRYALVKHSTGERMNGMIISGLYMTGKPNTKSSEILKVHGIRAMRESFFVELFLPKMNMAIKSPIRHPVPPMMTKVSIKLLDTICPGMISVNRSSATWFKTLFP